MKSQELAKGLADFDGRMILITVATSVDQPDSESAQPTLHIFNGANSLSENHMGFH
jgi:hypothetical protein